MARKKSIHYVNNAQFSQAVVDYVRKLEECKKEQAPLPKVSQMLLHTLLK